MEGKEEMKKILGKGMEEIRTGMWQYGLELEDKKCEVDIEGTDLRR